MKILNLILCVLGLAVAACARSSDSEDAKPVPKTKSETEVKSPDQARIAVTSYDQFLFESKGSCRESDPPTYQGLSSHDFFLGDEQRGQAVRAVLRLYILRGHRYYAEYGEYTGEGFAQQGVYTAQPVLKVLNGDWFLDGEKIVLSGLGYGLKQNKTEKQIVVFWPDADILSAGFKDQPIELKRLITNTIAVPELKRCR